jgi:hypothetical protein
MLGLLTKPKESGLAAGADHPIGAQFTQTQSTTKMNSFYKYDNL